MKRRNDGVIECWDDAVKGLHDEGTKDTKKNFSHKDAKNAKEK